MVDKRFYDCKVKLNLSSDMGTSEMKLKNSSFHEAHVELPSLKKIHGWINAFSCVADTKIGNIENVEIE